MPRTKNNFKACRIRNSKHLSSVVTSNIESKKTSHYIITNQWDKPCEFFNDRLPQEGDTDLYVIDIFPATHAGGDSQVVPQGGELQWVSGRGTWNIVPALQCFIGIHLLVIFLCF